MSDSDMFYYAVILLAGGVLFYLDDYQQYKWFFQPNHVLIVFLGVCSIVLIKHYIRHDQKI